MRTRFTNGHVIGAPGAPPQGDMLIENGVILADAPSGGETVVDLQGGYLLPGFIDVQVNGGGGVLFNADPSVAAIERIGAAHRAFGVTSFLPTLISDDLDKVAAAIAAVEAAIAKGVPGVVGIHLEGPFLSPAKKGTHDSRWFRRLDEAALNLLSSLTGGRTLVTLAPETCDLEDIQRLAEAGVRVSAGHTDASYARMVQAFDAGVTGVTHLFNAMSPFNHREPGVVGATLENRTAFAGIIVDGRHVSPAALRIALAARPKNRFMLVTDAMPTVGAATKTFDLGGKTIRVENGVCVDEDGVLSGSDLDMATALRNAVELLGLDVAEAAMMAAAAPAAFLGLRDRGTLAAGRRADLVWLDARLRPQGVWVGGVREQAQHDTPLTAPIPQKATA